MVPDALPVALLALITADDFWRAFDHTYDQYQGINPLHIVLMMVPFWVTVVSTWTFAIKPILKVIEDREKRTLGARAEAADFETRFNERFKAYEERLALTRKASAEERAKGRAAAEREAERVLSDARGDAGRALELARSEIENERVRVRIDLKRQAEQIAHELAEKALGRPIDEPGTAGEPKRGGAARGGVRS